MWSLMFLVYPWTTIYGRIFVYNVGSEDLLNIYRLTGMAPNDMAELDYKPNDQAKNTVPLPKGLRSYVTIFQAKN